MKSSILLIAIVASMLGKANAQNINPQKSQNMKETNQIEANQHSQDTSLLQKIENGAVSGYKAIENGVVSGYTKMQDGIVDGYTKLQDTIVAKVFTHPGETVEEAKARMQANTEKHRKSNN